MLAVAAVAHTLVQLIRLEEQEEQVAVVQVDMELHQAQLLAQRIVAVVVVVVLIQAPSFQAQQAALAS